MVLVHFKQLSPCFVAQALPYAGLPLGWLSFGAVVFEATTLHDWQLFLKLLDELCKDMLIFRLPVAAVTIFVSGEESLNHFCVDR